MKGRELAERIQDEALLEASLVRDDWATHRVNFL